jgi:hypothetical protein
MPSAYYPLCFVRLKIRFENFEIDAPPVQDTVSQGAVDAFGSGAADESNNPYVRTVDIQAYDCTVELNSPRMADTARVTIPRSKLPIDPQIVRSATLQVFMGVVSSEEYADAMGSIGAPGLVLPDVVPEGRPFAGQSNERFRGFIDNWEVTMDEGGGRIELSARDTTGFFIDAEIPENPLRDIPSDMTIDQVITAMISGDGLPEHLTRRGGLPGAKGTAVVVETSRPVPTLADIKPPTWFTGKKKATKGKKKAPKSKDMKFWDMVTDLCVAAGLKAYIRSGRTPVNIPGLGYVLPAAEIVITDAQTYYAGVTAVNRSFLYGHNCSELRIRRVLGGTPTPTIEVRSYDWETDQQITGRYPPGKTVNMPAASGSGDREEVVVYELDELTGPFGNERAIEAARHIFDQLARGEFQVSIRTSVLNADPANDGDELAPDMLYLMPGDSIRVLTDPAKDANGIQSVDGQPVTISSEEFVERMVSNGLPQDFAALVAKSQEDPRRQEVFYVQTVAITWNHKTGYKFDIQAINYLDVRHAVNT